LMLHLAGLSTLLGQTDLLATFYASVSENLHGLRREVEGLLGLRRYCQRLCARRPWPCIGWARFVRRAQTDARRLSAAILPSRLPAQRC
jgi:hypothetical protein